MAGSFRVKSCFLLCLALILSVNISSCRPVGDVTPQLPSVNFQEALNTSAAENSPRLSYDGRYLVFTSDRRRQREIRVYDRQRRRMLSLPALNPPGQFQDQPDISADGRYIVFVSEALGRSDIWLYDRQTANRQNLTQDLMAQVRRPTISGDGRFVAFERNRAGQWDIAIYDRGLGGTRSLPPEAPPPGQSPSPKNGT